jgi:copper chaperone CopZ
MTIEYLRVPALHTQQDSQTIQAAVQAVPGVWQVVVNLADQSVRVEHDGSAQVSTLIAAIRQAGYAEVFVLV